MRKASVGTFATLAMLLLLSGCPGPIYESARLKAVAAEARSLAATHPIDPSKGWAEVPWHEWPPAIASLRPAMVILHAHNVLIFIVPFFDGGWGYEIPLGEAQPGMPLECYEQPYQGVFWHGPC